MLADDPLVIVDTTVWIDYFGGRDTVQTVWLDRHLDSQRIGLTDLILLEILQGFRNDADFRQAKRELQLMSILPACGQDLAIASAENYRSLRKRGITLRKTIDCIIATYCIEHGHSLLHNDRDYDPFEQHLGLRVVHPQAY